MLALDKLLELGKLPKNCEIRHQYKIITLSVGIHLQFQQKLLGMGTPNTNKHLHENSTLVRSNLK